MKQLLAIFTGKLGYTDQEIITMLQSGIEKQVRVAEMFLFEKYRYMIGRMPFTETLKAESDREEAYSDANFAILANIKSGLFEKRSSLKTYFYEIFRLTCMTRATRNATNKNEPHRPETKPSEELLKDWPVDIQGKLRSEESADLWDSALKQFRHSNYRCYYVLALYDYAGFPYEDILHLSGKPAYELKNGTSFRPKELGGLDEVPLKLGAPTPEALKALASRCRAELRALFERSKHSNQTRKP